MTDVGRKPIIEKPVDGKPGERWLSVQAMRRVDRIPRPCHGAGARGTAAAFRENLVVMVGLP
jgi:hypothetical protein